MTAVRFGEMMREHTVLYTMFCGPQEGGRPHTIMHGVVHFLIAEYLTASIEQQMTGATKINYSSKKLL